MNLLLKLIYALICATLMFSCGGQKAETKSDSKSAESDSGDDKKKKKKKKKGDDGDDDDDDDDDDDAGDDDDDAGDDDDDAGDDDDDDAGDDDDDNTRAAGEPLGGEVADVDTDLENFDPKTVYALYSATYIAVLDTTQYNLSFIVTETEVTDIGFRDIDGYICRECDGDDDPNCAEPEESDDRSITVSFSPATSEIAGYKVDDEAWPTADTYEMLELPEATDSGYQAAVDANQQQGVAYRGNYYDFATGGQATGTANLTARPAAVGEDFEMELNLNLPDGSTFAGTLSGTVFQYPENPGISCPEGKWADPIYAEEE